MVGLLLEAGEEGRVRKRRKRRKEKFVGGV